MLSTNAALVISSHQHAHVSTSQIGIHTGFYIGRGVVLRSVMGCDYKIDYENNAAVLTVLRTTLVL